MKPQHEYFRIDTVGWVSQYERMSEEAKELDLNAHLWDLKIAVEHENSVKDWTDEIIKLIHIKCPLKVVIGYNYCKERGFTDQKKLDFIARWMQEKVLQKNTLLFLEIAIILDLKLIMMYLIIEDIYIIN